MQVLKRIVTDWRAAVCRDENHGVADIAFCHHRRQFLIDWAPILIHPPDADVTPHRIDAEQEKQGTRRDNQRFRLSHFLIEDEHPARHQRNEGEQRRLGVITRVHRCETPR